MKAYIYTRPPQLGFVAFKERPWKTPWVGLMHNFLRKELPSHLSRLFEIWHSFNFSWGHVCSMGLDCPNFSLGMLKCKPFLG